MNWNKIYFLMCVLFLFSCNKNNDYRFAGAQEILAQYVDFSSIKDGERILFYSTYTGCESCRRMVKNEMDSLQFIPGLYIITNNKSTPIKSNKIYFDSPDLINHTNVGFSGPTILEKRGDRLV